MILVNALRNHNSQTRTKEHEDCNKNSGETKHSKKYSTHMFTYTVINHDPNFSDSKMLNLMQFKRVGHINTFRKLYYVRNNVNNPINGCFLRPKFKISD